MEDFDDEDDFGDLYGDVELQASSTMNVVQQLSHLPLQNDVIHDNAIENSENDFSEEPSNSDDVNVNNALADEAVVMVAEEEGEEEEGSSESEDDLNIVLNDDYDDDEVEINTKINSGNSNHFSNGLCFVKEVSEEGNERYCKGTEQFPSGCSGGEGKGVVDGYNSQYKNMRFHAVRGDREDSGYIHRTCLSSLASQNGYNFSLPRSRTILDVNIDTFEQKPWRHPSADITDYFNFGFDEDSWRHYCNHLDKYREQTVTASRMSTSKSSRRSAECEMGSENGEFSNEAVSEKVAYSMQQHPELIKGSAIQVENCSFERQPSSDIWCPLDRDSDVIIQIVVQDLKENCLLSSAKEGVYQTDTFIHKAPEIENDAVDGAIDIHCSSSASEDELPSLEGHGDGSGNSLSERSSRGAPETRPVSMDSDNNGSVQISDSDEHHEQEWTDMNGIAKAMEASDGTGKSMGRKISNITTSAVEPESSNGGQSTHNPTSPSSCSRRERLRNGAYVDFRDPHQQSNVASLSSISELRRSVTYDSHSGEYSKSYGVETKPSDPKFRARSRSPKRDDLKYDKRRHDSKFHARSRSPTWDDLKYDKRRHDPRFHARSRSPIWDDLKYDKRRRDPKFHARSRSPIWDDLKYDKRRHDPKFHARGRSPPSDDLKYDKRHDPKFHARGRSPPSDDLKYDKRRHTYMSGLTGHVDDEGASYLSDSEGFHYTQRLTINHKEQKSDQHGIDSYGGSKTFLDHRDQKLSNYNDRDSYIRSQNWKAHSTFVYDMDQSHRQNTNESHSHFELRTSRVCHEEARQDFYHHERKRAVQDMERVTHEESRQWTSKYDHHLDNEEGIRWTTKAEDWQKRVKNDNFLIETHYESDLMREKCTEHMLYVNNDRGFLQHKYDKRLSYNRREDESPGRSARRCDSPLNGVCNTWGADYDGEKGRWTRSRSLSYGSCERPCSMSTQRWQGAESPKNGMHRIHGRNWRNTWAEKSNHNDRLHNFDSAFGADENIINEDQFVRRQHRQSEVSHWKVEQYDSTHWDNNVSAEGASYPFERVSGPRAFDAHRSSDHVEKLIDSWQVSRGKSKLTRGRHKGSQWRQNTNIIHGDNHGVTFPRCRDSVNSHLVGVDRKSTGRSFRAGNMFYDRYHCMDYDNDLKQKTIAHSNRSYSENVTRAENAKVDTKQKGKNWHDKFSDVQHNNSQDIEEGQILTEEVNEKTIDKMRPIGEEKNPLNENVAFEGRENPRILEIIAKMEKRRERFKQPITVTNEAEKISSTAVDIAVETSNPKPQRPARKRKWC